MVDRPAKLRPAWAEVDLGAIRDNARALTSLVAPAQLCAVVKADGYGHGAVPVARAALEGGATWLAVALVEEGMVLRAAGIEAPVLVLSEPPADAMAEAATHRLTPTLYTRRGIDAAASVATEPWSVHVKVDTGMHRVGASPADLADILDLVRTRSELRLEGVWTHLAVAEETDNDFTAEQLRRFEAAGVPDDVLRHAANSAGGICHEQARFDLVRAGIALYGYGYGDSLELRPALSLRARVTHVQRVAAGEAISYGQRYRLERDSTIATVPIGYADGVTRRLGFTGGEVVIRGRRRPIAGAVTMDQLMVDCGDDDVEVGDEVVLIGEGITADDWAARLDTISYEVLCGIGPRVPRVYV